MSRARAMGAQSRAAFCHTLGDCSVPQVKCVLPTALLFCQQPEQGWGAILAPASGQLSQSHCKDKSPPQQCSDSFGCAFNTCPDGASLWQEQREVAAVKV